MRALAAVLAVAAALALAGCSSQPNSPVDPETTGPEDYEVPLVLFVIALIVGVVLLVVNLSSQDRGKVSPPATPPIAPAAPAQPGWQAIDESEAQPAKRAAPAKSPPKPRRRAP